MSNKCICEINKGREMHRCYVQADTLLCNKDIDMNRYRYRYRYENINILGKHYFVVLNSTFGAQ